MQEKGQFRWEPTDGSYGFVNPGETGAEEVLQEQIKSSRVEEAPKQQKGEIVSVLLRRANHSKDSLPQFSGGKG